VLPRLGRPWNSGLTATAAAAAVSGLSAGVGGAGGSGSDDGRALASAAARASWVVLVFFRLDAGCTHPLPAHHEEVSYPKAIRRRKVP
jgi:hypothetical protein